MRRLMKPTIAGLSCRTIETAAKGDQRATHHLYSCYYPYFRRASDGTNHFFRRPARGQPTGNQHVRNLPQQFQRQLYDERKAADPLFWKQSFDGEWLDERRLNNLWSHRNRARQ
jgi:hypothetical protein